MKQGFWGCRGRWGCRGQWGQRGCRGSKAWKITTEDFRVNNILELSFILMFWRNLFFWYNHEISYWILAPFLSEAVEASRYCFFKNQEWILKIYHLRIPKLLPNKILLTYFTLSEPIHKIQFNVRYPWNFWKKIFRIGGAGKWPFFESAILNYLLHRHEN